MEFNDTCGDVVTPNALAGSNILGAGLVNDAFKASFEFLIGEFSSLKVFFVDILVAPLNSFF